ncbi:MAG: hypothetical protein M1133_00510 [Armatimonadetes bacterium]|nr:hypothetical protein [Armatimonadota bacterium]
MTANRARERAEEFLKISDQFKLGELLTESSHPVTANLSEVAKNDISAALGLLFEVDRDVIEKYREWVESGRSEEIAKVVTDALLAGGRIFFTGCGATGRLSILLDSIWRDFWQRAGPESRKDWENRTISIMAGGDFALIKSVEGFEDITAFGRRQIAEQGVRQGDVVFAITEGGETSWVIGTAWEALERGAKVYFVYNNPDDILCEHVQRSREIIEEPRIEKINLTTGPMAITGSTRMQATSIQLCVMLTILEIVVKSILNRENASFDKLRMRRKRERIPERFREALEEIHATLMSEEVRGQLAGLVEMEERIYRAGHKVNYFADDLAIDVLTDTTERSPTFCTPSFRKYDDEQASESWAFLFLPYEDTRTAWEKLLKRKPRAVEWSLEQVREMVGDEDAALRYEVIRKISLDEIYKFKIGLDGLPYRHTGPGNGSVEISAPEGYLRMEARGTDARTVPAPVPKSDFLLNGPMRVEVKMLLNAISTCTMVRLGRVMGNYMIYVVPSNLKLIDRATRYVSRLTDLSYEDACRLLFEVIEYVEPRMKADQAYPPVVEVAVMRARGGIGNEEAEKKIADCRLQNAD